MTLDVRARALEPLGFSPRQARFVAAVALTGGYCLRRQYLSFARIKYGRNVRDLLDGLVDRRLAERSMLRSDRGHVYHVYGKSIYRVLGQENNRNRRSAGDSGAIARKIMMLDAILLDTTMAWYLTEPDKVDLFTNRFGVPLADLPQRRYESQAVGVPDTTRYFFHKLPIGIRNDTVFFLLLVTDRAGAPFESFLQDHAPLLGRLDSWAVAVVCPMRVDGDRQCRIVFDRFLNRPQRPDYVSAVDLRWFFEIRELLDHRHHEVISPEDDAPRFNALWARLRTPEYEQLYAEWVRRGPSALTEHLAAKRTPHDGLSPEHGGLIVRRLEHNYRHFHDFASGNS